MAGFGDFIGKAGSSAEQLFVWQVLGQVLGALGSPYFAALQQASLRNDPNTPMGIGEAVELAARKLIDTGQAHDYTSNSGLSGGLTDQLIDGGLRSPDITVLAEAVRRKLIELGGTDPHSPSFGGALTDAGIRPEWHDIMGKLVTQVPTVAEVMNAWLEGQIEEGEARTRYLEAGGDPTWFQTSYNANGQAPTPVQSIELLNRGIIPEGGTGPDATSYQQAFLEGPWRNKWLPAFLALRDYLPPPRTVTAMYREGSLTHDEAASLLAKQGLTSHLVTAYLSAGQTAKASTEKHLTKTELIELYRDRLLDKTAARDGLTKLGYAAHDADELLSLADVRVAASQTNAAVTRVRTLYLAGKLTRAQAVATLGKLGVPAATVTDVIDVWELQHSAKVKTLTPAQVVTAWFYKLLTRADAIARLVADGYDEADATLLLAIHGKGPLVGVAPGQPGGPVTGGGG